MNNIFIRITVLIFLCIIQLFVLSAQEQPSYAAEQDTYTAIEENTGFDEIQENVIVHENNKKKLKIIWIFFAVITGAAIAIGIAAQIMKKKYLA